MHIFSRLICFLLVVLAGKSVCGSKDLVQRDWTAAGGDFRTTAVFVRKTLGRVVLRRADGVELDVAVERLSQADRDYIADRLRDPTLVPESLRGPNAADAYVAVLFSYTNYNDQIASATVFHEDDRYRYIATGNLPAGSSSRLRPGEFLGEMFAMVGEGEKLRRVELSKVNLVNNRLVLAAPKEELPPPFRPTPDAVARKRGDRLWLVGFEMRGDSQAMSFARVVTEVFVDRVYYDFSGKPNQFQVDCPRAVTMSAGAIVDAQGKAVALAHGRPPVSFDASTTGRHSIPISSYTCYSPSVNSALFAPSLLTVAQHVTLKNLKEAEIELLVQAFDPTPTGASKAKLHLLYVEKQPSSKNGTEIQLRDGVWINKTETNGSVVELVPVEQLDPKFSQALPTSMPGANTTRALQSPEWPKLANWTASIPFVPDDKRHQFDCRVVTIRPDGKYEAIAGVNMISPPTVWLSQEQLRELREAEKLRLKPHPAGGHFVTDRSTAVDLPPRELSSALIPKPETRDRRVLATIEPHKTCALGRFDQTVIKTGAANPCSAAVSGDGKWLYVIDSSAVLHRIDVETWTERQSLALPKKFGGVRYSEHGLIIPLIDQHALWILDPETLEFKFQVVTPKPSLIAASAKSNWAYLFTRDDLRILDVSTGRIVHVIDGERFTLAVGGVPDVSYQGVTLSDDGRRLILDYNHSDLYRREGNDLILDERITNPRHWSGTADGKYLVTFHRFPNQTLGNGFRIMSDDRERIVKFDVQLKGDLEKKVKYDSEGGYCFAVNGFNFQIFDTSGKSLAEPITLGLFYRPMVIPGGRGCLAISDKNIVVIDTKPERLSKALVE